MGFLYSINVVGQNEYLVDPMIEIIPGNEAAITAVFEGMFGGALTGDVVVAISPDSELSMSIANSPYSFTSIETEDPRNTFLFTEESCAEAPTLAGTGCSGDDAILSLIASLKRDFPTCCRTGSSEAISGEVVPVGTIYYGSFGEDGDAAAASGDLELLTTASQISFEGSFAFPAVNPALKKYIAYPVSWGLPTTIYDPTTGLPYAMGTVYQVTIDSVLCYVLSTYYAHDADLIITLI